MTTSTMNLDELVNDALESAGDREDAAELLAENQDDIYNVEAHGSDDIGYFKIDYGDQDNPFTAKVHYKNGEVERVGKGVSRY